jgi:hypothetical protein
LYNFFVILNNSPFAQKSAHFTGAFGTFAIFSAGCKLNFYLIILKLCEDYTHFSNN